MDLTRAPRDLTAAQWGGLWFALAIGVVLVVGAVTAQRWATAERTANIGRLVAAQGYGQAVVEPIRGPACWRARQGFRWRTDSHSGWACAGPGDEVWLHLGPWTGTWP